MQFSRLHNRNPLRITLKGGKSGELKWIWYIIHHTYICGTEQYYTADIWPNSHRGGVGCFSHTVQNDRNALPKRKSFVWTFVRVCAYVCICKWVCVCVCVCVNVYIGNVDAEQLYIAVIYLHPYTKLFSGSPIVGRPQGCTFPRELYKCNGSNFCVDSATHTFYCPSAI